MVVSSLFIQALPGLLMTQQDLNSSASDLDSLLAAQKTKKGFNLVPSALAAKYTLTMHFSFASCLQANRFRSLVIDWSVRRHVIPDRCFIHCYYT